LAGSAFFIFLLRQFFMTIPRELEDAALIDGCSRFRIFRSIILPLAKPVLATVTIFAFMGAWNDYLGPLIYLGNEDQYTLTLGLQAFVQYHRSEWGMLMAASTMMVLPVVLLFFFAQQHFVQGITLTGIKG
jgi:multiple sugar transport system permease protein